ALSCLGADISRGGQDKTVISARYGPWFAPLKKHQGAVTSDGPGAAALVVQEHDGKAAVHIDVIGIGASAYDILKAMIGSRAVPVNFAAVPGPPVFDRSGALKMTNVRAAAWWGLREALDPELGVGLCLPADAELLADLTAPRYEVTAAGVKLESKEH